MILFPLTIVIRLQQLFAVCIFLFTFLYVISLVHFAQEKEIINGNQYSKR